MAQSPNKDRVLSPSGTWLRPYGDGRERLPLRHTAILALLFSSLCIGVVAFYFFVEYREGHNARTLASADAQQLGQRLQLRMDELTQQLRLLRTARRNGRLQSVDQFIALATAIHHDFPNCEMIAVVDASGQCLWHWPAGDPQMRSGVQVSEDAYWREAMFRSVEAGSEVLTGWSAPPDQPPSVGIALAIQTTQPLRRGPAVAIARFSPTPVVEGLIDPHLRREYNFELLDGQQTIARSAEPPQSSAAGQLDTPVVRVADRTWKLQIAPNSFSAGQRVARLARWILWVGIPFSFAATAILWQLLALRVRDRVRQTRRYLGALESLNEISTAISAKLASGPQVLDQLAESARRLLQMDRSGIALLDARDGTLNVSALAGNVPRNAGKSYALASLPAIQQCIQSGDLLFEEDIDRSPRQANRQVFKEFDARAAIIIPLQVEGRCIGLMALSSSAPRGFSDADRRLARLLGSQASVILANNRLYDRMSSALDMHKQLLEQQDRLHAASAAVYQAATADESARAIVERGPDLLGVDMCIVSLLTEMGDEMIVKAATGRFASLVSGQVFKIAGTNAGKVLGTGELIVIEDATNDLSLHPRFRLLAQVGGIIYVPLFRSDRQPLGMITFIRHEPGTFSAAQRRLCRVFGDRAAAAIENVELHEQTRRDARTRAVLLRELQHRVKNNLAGIVGLLSMNEPDLDPAARQWLDRAVGRVRAMAQAYDLFSGGIDCVELRQLIAQVLPSLSVILPPGVVIRSVFDGVDVRLATSQAVSLAMVLHELCCNAILHGLGEAGTLSLEARRAGTGRIAIDVIDDGRGFVADIPADARVAVGDGPGEEVPSDSAGRWGPDLPRSGTGREQGMGLELVSELVARELRGSFELRPRPGGGTIATIEFPVGNLEPEGTAS